jgi:hypothetical protein
MSTSLLAACVYGAMRTKTVGEATTRVQDFFRRDIVARNLGSFNVQVEALFETEPIKY